MRAGIQNSRTRSFPRRREFRTDVGKLDSRLRENDAGVVEPTRRHAEARLPALSRFLLFLLLLTLSACQTSETPDGAETSEAVAPYQVYGESLTPDDAVSVISVAAAPSTYVGSTVKMEGEVMEVCQMKGCWLTLKAASGPDVRIRVPKTDTGEYLYTVPTGLSGRRVVVEGKLEQNALSEDEQRHYAEDVGGDLDGDVQPFLELSMTASGVLVMDETG